MRSHESAHQLRPVVVVSCSKLREALLDRLVDRLALCALALDALLSPTITWTLCLETCIEQIQGRWTATHATPAVGLLTNT